MYYCIVVILKITFLKRMFVNRMNVVILIYLNINVIFFKSVSFLRKDTSVEDKFFL